MTVLRYSSDAWGQSVLEGVSWDLLGVFFFVTTTAIVLHALYMWRIEQPK
ncbi:MAG: hypothetical protein HOI43_02555 [Gammaproteobacteria bacterium]|nr:hypothetical protein [Gammaproteobacteria bacterium]